MRERPSAEALLAELGIAPRLTVYLASAPGAGKTRRIVEEALALAAAGKRVAIGIVETKGRPDLDALVAPLRRIPPRKIETATATFTDFDLEAALADDAEVIVLDELAHGNLPGATNAKRWQDALALRRAGRSVLGAFNVQHLENVAPIAESLLGFPIREIIPISFLKACDQVIAIDVSVEVIESRLREGRIVRVDDISRAAEGVFKRSNLQVLRELLLRTLDDLTDPILEPARSSNALVIVPAKVDPAPFLRRVAAFASALDLAIDVAPETGTPSEELDRATRAHKAEAVTISLDALRHGRYDAFRASVFVLARGELAELIANRPLDRDVLILCSEPPAFVGTGGARHPYAQTAGDRLRIGYGELTIYLGAVAGSGKTYAMLERGHQLLREGIDVVAGLVETHGRVDTAGKLAGLEVLPRLPNGEMDRDALLARRPKVALIDELAHSNPPGSAFAKRYDEVLSILRAGISVITTLNVQHLEGLSDVVYRLTGTRVRETLPDGILELADEVIFIDVTPERLRERLRDGKVYPKERIDAALTNFFRIDNLTALRELAVRETLHARSTTRLPSPFSRIVVGVKARERDITLIERMARLAARLEIDLTVVHAVGARPSNDPTILAHLERATRLAHARWIAEPSDDAAGLIVRVAADSPGSLIAVEAIRTQRRLFPKKTFARRVFDAGESELLFLVPRDEPPQEPNRNAAPAPT